MKRFQIPVDEKEDRLFHRAAKRVGLPAAEWARRRLKIEADRTLSSSNLTPQQILNELRNLNAPTGNIEDMIRESVEGRYGKFS